MLVKKTAQYPHKTSPNYSPKFAIKLAVCTESNQHYHIAVAIFVQHSY